ncbi:hypothetical protein FA15DRAFT_586562 [Coprinopsis marcescibilis]|uniref:Uncharacterized protein n=1 Tax=Coprinopsis marcescibilis TaxID=230819 RepID=A0A5C3L5B2_COPMA|nr:hypothetical protein FA15DRAFT_586562 [Coprinopsis marcescibilis]
MVQLILSSTKGNQGGKYFPYVGYLGLTPVRVEGLVRTRLDSDFKTLPCKSLTISVRCYESRIGRVNTLQSNILVDYTQTLWQKPDDQDYEHVDVLEFPFRIWVPTAVAGFSTAVFVDYRCTWRVEAVLHHAPITGVGSRQVRHFELPLIRYDVPRMLAQPEQHPDLVFEHQTSKPKTPRVRYTLRLPSQPTGPLDLVSIPLHMQPVDAGVSIFKASVIIERRIQLHDQSSASVIATASSEPTSVSDKPSYSSQHSSAPSPHSPALPSPSQPDSPVSSLDNNTPPASSKHHHQYHHQPTQSTSSLSSSNPTITPETVYPSNVSVLTYDSEHPLLPKDPPSNSSQPLQHPASSSPPTPNGHSIPQQQASPFSFATLSNSSKVVTNLIVGTETEKFARDSRGVWSKTLTLQWPASKSQSRWAIGETINSDLVSVRFFIRIFVTSPGGGTDSLELVEKELLVVSTNESERQLALAKYAEIAESSQSSMGEYYQLIRSKSKSPRRLRADDSLVQVLPEDLPPSPALPHPATPSKKAKTPRRPHTSAGPRDKSSLGRGMMNAGGASSNGASGSGGGGESSRKRRSDLGWAHPSMQPVPKPDPWGPPGARKEIIDRPSSTRREKERPKSRDKDSGKPKTSGRLSSSSFWAVSAPPLKGGRSSGSGSVSGSSKGSVGKETRSAGAVLSTSSTSTTASSSSVSSNRSFGFGGGFRSNGNGVATRRREGDVGVYSDEEEERRRAAPHANYPYISSSLPSTHGLPPPSSFKKGDEAHHHVREWEEELARIEEKSRKESDAAGFGRMRKRSLMTAVKGFLTSPGSSSS